MTTEGLPNASEAKPMMPIAERTRAVLRVLVITFFFNLTACVIKVAAGLAFNLTAVLADGLHSLSDAFINVIGFVSVKLSGRPPNESHPYGYQKYETVATMFIGCLTLLLFFEVFRAGIDKLLHPVATQMSPLAYAAMAGSAVVNTVTAIYERGEGKRLKSELLMADSAETLSDVLVSLGILVGLFFLGRGAYWLEGAMSIAVSLIVLRTAVSIFKEAVRVLVDESMIDAKEIIAVACAHPDVRWAHAVRSRGKESAIYVDMHLGVAPETTVEDGHDRISHEVKKALCARFPEIRCVMIHMEPDNESARKREHSVFKEADY